MPALALAAVGGTGREAGVALAANLLVAVVLAGQHLERGLNDTTTQTRVSTDELVYIPKHKVERALLLNVVVREGTAVLQLLAGEDQPLLVRRNALLVLNLRLHNVDRVARLDLQSDRLASESLDKDLHGGND